ncbi:MAG TPA: hypothetical protein VH374_23020 [Polyangia bacterium]|nr:hypothetical protein [Polyangia bacterium]
MDAAPLYLHTWTLAADSHPTPRLVFQGTASVLEGATDYTYLPVVLGTNQATLAVVPRIFSTTVDASAQARASRTVRFELALRVFQYRPVDEDPAATFVLPHLTTVTVTPGVAFRLSALDELTLSTGFETQYISALQSAPAVAGQPLMVHSVTGLTVIPGVGWRTSLARHASLELRAGIALTHLSSAYPIDTPSSVTPIGKVTLDQRLLSLRGTVLQAMLGASVDYYVDPILGAATPRGTAMVILSLLCPPDWSVGFEGYFFSTLQMHATTSGDTTYYPDEVAASVAVPVRHRISDSLTVEFGGRWADRAPFYSRPGSFIESFHQRQLWLYVLFAGTSRVSRSVGTP